MAIFSRTAPIFGNEVGNKIADFSEIMACSCTMILRMKMQKIYLSLASCIL